MRGGAGAGLTVRKACKTMPVDDVEKDPGRRGWEEAAMHFDTIITNGTIVNGIRVQEMALRPGDTVRIGVTTLRVE